MNSFVVTSHTPKAITIPSQPVLKNDVTNGGQYYFSSIGEPFVSLIFWSSGYIYNISRDVCKEIYLNTSNETATTLLKKAIRNLLNIRNHLALQLDLECGNISEDYFEKEENKYLTEVEQIPLPDLYEEVSMLLRLSNMPLDAEEVSGILNCSIDGAEAAIKNFISGGVNRASLSAG
jgi:hypothetical protein